MGCLEKARRNWATSTGARRPSAPTPSPLPPPLLSAISFLSLAGVVFPSLVLARLRLARRRLVSRALLRVGELGALSRVVVLSWFLCWILWLMCPLLFDVSGYGDPVVACSRPDWERSIEEENSPALSYFPRGAGPSLSI